MKLTKLSNNTGDYPNLSAIPFEVTCPSELVHGYFEAMHWIMGGNVQDGQEEPYESTSDSLILNAIALCERFYRANQAEIDEGEDEGDFKLSQLGHDLYLKTQGHGAGFWEKDYPRSMIFDEWVEENANNRDTEYASSGVLYSVSGDIDKDIALLKAEHPSAFEFITVERTTGDFFVTSIYLRRVLEALPIPSEEGTLLGGVYVVVKGRRARAIAYDDYAADHPVLVIYEDGAEEWVSMGECKDAL